MKLRKHLNHPPPLTTTTTTTTTTAAPSSSSKVREEREEREDVISSPITSPMAKRLRSATPRTNNTQFQFGLHSNSLGSHHQHRLSFLDAVFECPDSLRHMTQIQFLDRLLSDLPSHTIPTPPTPNTPHPKPNSPGTPLDHHQCLTCLKHMETILILHRERRTFQSLLEHYEQDMQGLQYLTVENCRLQRKMKELNDTIDYWRSRGRRGVSAQATSTSTTPHDAFATSNSPPTRKRRHDQQQQKVPNVLPSPAPEPASLPPSKRRPSHH